jgi:hypothetical protein
VIVGRPGQRITISAGMSERRTSSTARWSDRLISPLATVAWPITVGEPLREDWWTAQDAADFLAVKLTTWRAWVTHPWQGN